MNRIALVMHTTSYGAADFVEACRRAGSDVVLASDRCHVLDRVWMWPADSLVIDFSDPDGAAATIAAAADAAPISAVLPVGGELPAKVAAAAARRLGLPANAPATMAAAANKLLMRRQLAAAAATDPAIRQPRFAAFACGTDPDTVAERVGAPDGVGFPCVVKPLMLSGSRGVMRADDRPSLAAAIARLERLLADPAVRRPDPEAAAQFLVESFVPGPELALEGLLTRGALQVLALFDKPDPLDGPTFEETIYVTPSRRSAADQRRLHDAVAAAARALGLETGPVHAELRFDPAQGPVLIEMAARPIGGLCSRTLRFEYRWGPSEGPQTPPRWDSGGEAACVPTRTGLSLEDVVVRHALGAGDTPTRVGGASGVMMIPTPARVPSALRAVGGVEAARAVPGIDDVVISVRVGETLVPLPEGQSYTGFVFATGETPALVEQSLRDAVSHLHFTIAPLAPVTR